MEKRNNWYISMVEVRNSAIYMESRKGEINKRELKITFSEACYVLADKYQLSSFDIEYSNGEDRRYMNIVSTINTLID